MAIRDLQAARDQLEVGCEVLIKKGNNHYRGVVVEMMARMAHVRLKNGGKIEIHSLTNLTRVVDTAEELPTPPPGQYKRSPTKDWPVKAVAQVESALATVGKLAVQPGEVTPPPNDFKAWLAQGVTIARGMQDAIDTLANKEQDLKRDSEALLEEADRLAKEAAAVAKERQELTRQFDQLMLLAGKVNKEKPL